MTRTEALRILRDNYNNPIFNVKIGVCSPQVVNVTFEEALEEFDRCASRFRPKHKDCEFVFIYCSDFVKDSLRGEIDKALTLFDLGL